MGTAPPPSRVKHTWQGYSGGWVGVRVRPPKNLADTFLHIGASSRPSPWLVLWPSVPDTHVINALRRFRAAPTFAAFGAPRFVRVASGQLVDSKTRNRAHASRPRSGALSTTRRAIGLSRATQSSSTPAVLAAAAGRAARHASDLDQRHVLEAATTPYACQWCWAAFFCSEPEDRVLLSSCLTVLVATTPPPRWDF